MFVDEFYSSGVPYFGTAHIEAASAIFGNNNVLQVNNVDLIIDFTADGDVTFEFLDMGGSVNLQVNGFGAVLEAEDMAMLAGTVAPGIVLNVAVVAVGGGHRGTATLTGPVHTLRVGGQEFWLDGMACHNGVSSPALGACDYQVTHESLLLGETWDSGTSFAGRLDLQRGRDRRDDPRAGLGHRGIGLQFLPRGNVPALSTSDSTTP